MTVNQASSQQLFPLICSFLCYGAYRRIKAFTSQYWFRFEETNKDHIVISGIPVNVTESEVSWC
jgi:DNA mismatch repair protein MutL